VTVALAPTLAGLNGGLMGGLGDRRRPTEALAP
jgi:hypothetical protein